MGINGSESTTAYRCAGFIAYKYMPEVGDGIKLVIELMFFAIQFGEKRIEFPNQLYEVRVSRIVSLQYYHIRFSPVVSSVTDTA
jgi:hypothetical protein